MQSEKSGLVDKLKARIAYLENEYHKTLDAIKSATERGDFRPAPGTVRNVGEILEDTATRIMRLAPFDCVGLWLVDEETSDFKLGCCLPQGSGQIMASEFERLVTEGIVSLALTGEQPVFAAGSGADDRYLIQSLATASRVKGLFIGRLNSQQVLPDVTLPLLVILTQGCAASLENLELYRLLREKHAMLEESEDRYSNVMSAINDGIWDWDIESGRVYFDDRYYLMAGYEPDEFPHAMAEWEKRVHPDDLDYCRQQIQAHFSGKSSTFDIEFRFLKKDGSWMWMRGRGRVVRWDEAGRPVRMVGTHTDITDRRLAEESRKKLQSQLNQIQKMESVGILAGGIAHDFNNLLQVMAGSVQLALRDKSDDHDDYRRLQTIFKAIERAGKLVRQLLLFSRKADTEMQSMDINSSVRDAVELLERTIPRMISIELHLEEKIKQISADPLQVEQMLLNLCSNAADAMPDGGRLILTTENTYLDDDFVRAHIGSRHGHHVLLTVADTGIGMDKETLSHVFDPFFTTKESGKGTGLGLASVYGIVKAHNGYISCSSEPGKGSSFRIYFPVSQQEARTPKKRPRKVMESLEGTETILVVDDEDDIREITAEVLESSGYEVLTAASGEQALDVFSDQGSSIDMVILDLNMPGMGGRQCLREILNINSELPVLISSGYTVNGMARETIESGSAGFIAKPYQAKELLTKVREVMDARK